MKSLIDEAKVNTSARPAFGPIRIERRDDRAGPPNLSGGVCRFELPILFGHMDEKKMTLRLDSSVATGQGVRIDREEIRGTFVMQQTWGGLEITLIPESKK